MTAHKPVTEDLIVIPIGRWHQCEHVDEDRTLRTHRSAVVMTESGWTFHGEQIIHCPWCGGKLPRPSYQLARWDASPW